MSRNKIKTIIVEDELYDRKLIEKILNENYNDLLNIIDIVSNVEDAVASINKYKPQLLFLDIELNGDRNGAFNILNQVKHNFKIIFVTAKSGQDDLLKAIKLSCIDYLIKPTKISDFKEPINKVLQELSEKKINENNRIATFKHNLMVNDNKEAKISLQTGYSYIPVNLENIIRCEAEGNYSKFYFVGEESKLINGNLKSFEERLSGFAFCRVNKSDIINLQHIKSFSKKNITWEVKMQDNKVIYISNQRKQGFLYQYNEYHL